jgi:thiol-disulfide isomerase/thioredoxin
MSSDDLPFLHEARAPDPPEPPARGRWSAARDLLIGVLLFGVLLGVVGRWRSPALPTVAPDFALPALSGGAVSLSALRGQTVVLNFWATWCGPCRIEIPTFSAFAAAHPDIPVLGIAVDGDPADLRRAASQLGISYPVLLADRATLSAWKVGTLPMTAVIDPAGTISSVHTGLMLRPHLAWATGKLW